MGKKGPRRGSLAYWHRRRAARLSPRVRAWPSYAKGVLAFPGYKAGMAHVVFVEDRESPMKGQEVTRAVTVVETPPVFVYSVVGYKKTPYGLKVFAEVPSLNPPKELKRIITIAKKAKSKIEALKDASEIRLVVSTQPWKTGLKKTPEVMEIAVGGPAADAIQLAEKWLGKELPLQEVFQAGNLVDVIAVTTGKGWQGVVKRFGVALNPRKATGARRHGGTLGGETQAKVMYSVPRPGQTGFFRRTDRNKRIMMAGQENKSFKPFRDYGQVKSSFVVLEGSIPGPSKRMVLMRSPLVEQKPRKPEIKEIVA